MDIFVHFLISVWFQLNYFCFELQSTAFSFQKQLFFVHRARRKCKNKTITGRNVFAWVFCTSDDIFVKWKQRWKETEWYNCVETFVCTNKTVYLILCSGLSRVLCVSVCVCASSLWGQKRFFLVFACCCTFSAHEYMQTHGYLSHLHLSVISTHTYAAVKAKATTNRYSFLNKVCASIIHRKRKAKKRSKITTTIINSELNRSDCHVVQRQRNEMYALKRTYAPALIVKTISWAVRVCVLWNSRNTTHENPSHCSWNCFRFIL